MSWPRRAYAGHALLCVAAGVITGTFLLHGGVNPWGLGATGLVVWGAVAHAVADWPLQNDWMAKNKARRRERTVPDPHPGPDLYDQTATIKVADRWWDRHPAAYVHAAVYYVLLALVFGWPALPLAVTHLLIDTRTPLVWWARIMGQTAPRGDEYLSADAVDPYAPYEMNFDRRGSRVRWALPELDEAVASTQIATYLRQLEDDRKELEARLLRRARPAFDMGTLVRMASDQVAHLALIAVAALVVSL